MRKAKLQQQSRVQRRSTWGRRWLLFGCFGALASVSCGGSSTGGSGDGGAGGTANGGAGAGGSGGVSSGNLACKVTSDCVLVANGCCGTCGPPTSADVLAVNKARVDAVHAEVCPEQTPCPKCASYQNPALIATCQAGLCKVVDLREHPVTECAQDSDCRLRTNVCCECNGPTDPGHLTAVGPAGGIEALVCDPDAACPECGASYPADALAVCLEGHCMASYYVE